MMKCLSLLIVLVVLHLFPCCDAKCSPSACGVLSNISSPFRLNGDPKNCSDRRYELRCENNVTFVYLKSIKYYVKAIDYQNSTIRMVDASINNDDLPTSIKQFFPLHRCYYCLCVTNSSAAPAEAVRGSGDEEVSSSDEEENTSLPVEDREEQEEGMTEELAEEVNTTARQLRPRDQIKPPKRLQNFVTK